jgi:hypothetical protein
MTAGDTVAVETAGTVEDPRRIKVIGRGIGLPQIAHLATRIGYERKQQADMLKC